LRPSYGARLFLACALEPFVATGHKSIRQCGRGSLRLVVAGAAGYLEHCQGVGLDRENRKRGVGSFQNSPNYLIQTGERETRVCGSRGGEAPGQLVSVVSHIGAEG